MYRLRIRFSSDAWTTAGPAAAYRYYAISANPEHVADAVVESGVTHESLELNKYTNRADIEFCFIGSAGLNLDTLAIYCWNTSTQAFDILATKNTDYIISTYDGVCRIRLQGIFDSDSHTTVKAEYDRIEAGEVKITIIGPDGELPSADVQAQVLAACSDPNVKPLTDHVSVSVPDVHTFSIDLTYYTTAADEDACVETVEGEDGAIARYVKWQEGAINRDLNPDYLRKLILAPDWEGAVGATMVDVVSPTYVNLPPTTMAKWDGTLTVSHVVREGVV